MRSEPPRPSVATLPSGRRPMKPGTTGTVPRATSGFRTRAAQRRRVGDERGGAAVGLVGAHELQRVDELRPAVRGRDSGSQQRRGKLLAAADHRVARARLEMPQHADGAAELVELGGGPIDLGLERLKEPPLLDAEPRRGVVAAAKGLDRPAPRPRGCPEVALRCGVEQEIGDAAQRRSDDGERPFVRRDTCGRTLDGVAIGQ